MKISEKCFTLIAILLFGSVHFTNAQVVNANVPMIKLNNGLEMPQFGLGTFTASNEACKEACLVALKAGYRHIDTAHAYGNESGVGSAVKESGVPREEIWITSKIWPSEYGEGTTEALEKNGIQLQC